MLELLLWVIGAHFIGDYAMQSDWMAKNKGKSIYVMIAHCAIYTVVCAIPFEMFGACIPWVMGIIFITHFFSDYLKCNNLYGLAIDQTIHILILVSMVTMYD